MSVRACANVLLFPVNAVFPEQSGGTRLLKGWFALESFHADYLEVFFFFPLNFSSHMFTCTFKHFVRFDRLVKEDKIDSIQSYQITIPYQF